MNDTEYSTQKHPPRCRLPHVSQVDPPPKPQAWTTGLCPNCGFTQAAVDPDGILWCPACGYSKKGAFT